MSHLLELNDWQLSCYTEQGQCIYEQAAAAFAKDNQVTFGGPALAQGLGPHWPGPWSHIGHTSVHIGPGPSSKSAQGLGPTSARTLVLADVRPRP